MTKPSVTGKAIVCGLVFWTSPIFAQDYIDVEAERMREQQGYGQSTAQPTQQAPAYGSGTATGMDAGELYYKLQLLEQEVMQLRGKLEEQEFQLRQLREQSLERYMDLDRRLSGGGAATPPASTAPSTPRPAAPSGPAPELPGESDAYRAAYGLVRSQQFDEAVSAFRQFLVDFPSGRFAPNAHYWLGELYLVIAPPDEESARREFVQLLEQYPDHGKVPDALYKLGRIYFDRGDRDRAREYFDRVVNEFGNTGSSAVKLARDFLSSNY
jgi:tol-pal system protein YbgF